MQVIPVDIREHIDTDFKVYSMYVIQSRGIPNFYDSLTPVQRLILQHAPDKLQTTVALVGQVMATGLYHHGDMSLTKAINKLAKPFGCSRKMLQGDGFFGSPVNPKPASSRYTKIKSDPKTKELISRYKNLNKRNSEGNYDWLHVDLPVALSTHIVGIAVGYRTNILPRKMEDVEEYLDGKNKKLYPYFDGFRGKIKKYPDRDKGWILEGEFAYDDAKMTMKVGDLPPLVKYTTFVSRLNKKLGDIGDRFTIINNSKKTVDMTIKWRTRASWEDARDAVEKLTKMAVIEQYILVKNGAVVEYDNIHDYLDEFRIHRERVIHMQMTYELRVSNYELDFLRAKREFLLYMMEKKRKAQEIKTFIKKFKNPMIRRRLDAIKLTALSPETVKEVERLIDEMVKQIKGQEKDVAKQLAKCKKLEKGFKGKGKVSLGTALFDVEDPYQLDGIDVFDVEEAFDDDEMPAVEEDEDEDF